MRKMILIAVMGMAAVAAQGQWNPGWHTAQPTITQMADTAMTRWPLGDVRGTGPKWTYEEGTLLEGVYDAWLTTGDGRYYAYIKASVDALVDKQGHIATYKGDDYELDSVLMGRMALMLYGVTLDKRYYLAAKTLRAQLEKQPRTTMGGYWHKQRYTQQMWLDGLYMAEPFYAEYAQRFQEPKDYEDILLQFTQAEKHLRDTKTGLLYHGWDAAHEQRWADAETGRSHEFWSRGMGWYAMALVDVLDSYPAGAGRDELVGILNRLAAAVVAEQDAKSGLWWQVTDKAGAKGNYLESSASAMFVYALAKGVRKGWLPVKYEAAAERGYNGLLAHEVTVDAAGAVHLANTVGGCGLGASSATAPYRDGSYAYYVGEKIVTDDAKGYGAMLMAASEAAVAGHATEARGLKVVVDAWYNSQVRVNAAGQTESYHYKWSDHANSGYSLWGRMFEGYGVQLGVLAEAPTAANLKGSDVYIIASPDIPSKNPNPHFMTAEEAAEVAAWVNRGGVLVMMHNDVTFTEFEKYNMLAEKFGIHLNAVDNNSVPGTDEEMGKLMVAAGHPFLTPGKIFMKDICSITVKAPAKGIMDWQGNTVMAVAKVGRGTVFATVDPWLYNEYTDGRKLPKDFRNFEAGEEFTRWILKQARAGSPGKEMK